MLSAGIARQIKAIDADKRLKAEKPDPDLVNEIAYFRGDINSKKDHFLPAFSFPTKYCSWHRPDRYPIADSYSKGMLYYLNEADGGNSGFIEYGDSDRSMVSKIKFMNITGITIHYITDSERNTDLKKQIIKQ